MDRASFKTAMAAGAALALGSFTADVFVAPGVPQTSVATSAGVAASPAQAAQAGSSSLTTLAAPAAVVAAVAMAAKRGTAATAQRRAVVSTHGYDASKEIGVTEPMGFFDPCNFMKDADEATFKDYREKEIKHGRVSMLALIGFLVQPFAESAHIGFSGVPGGTGALTTYPGSAGFGVLFLVTGFFELRILPDLKGEEPGSFSDPLRISTGGVGAYDDKWRNMELNNSRLAMISVIGTITAGFYTGLDAYGQWAGAKGAAIDFIKHTLQNAAP